MLLEFRTNSVTISRLMQVWIWSFLPMDPARRSFSSELRPWRRQKRSEEAIAGPAPSMVSFIPQSSFVPVPQTKGGGEAAGLLCVAGTQPLSEGKWGTSNLSSTRASGAKAPSHEGAKAEGGTCRGSPAAAAPLLPHLPRVSSPPSHILPLPPVWLLLSPASGDATRASPLLRAVKAGRRRQLPPFPAALPSAVLRARLSAAPGSASPPATPCKLLPPKNPVTVISPPAPGRPDGAGAHRGAGAGTLSGHGTGETRRAVSCPLPCSQGQAQSSPCRGHGTRGSQRRVPANPRQGDAASPAGGSAPAPKGNADGGGADAWWKAEQDRPCQELFSLCSQRPAPWLTSTYTRIN